MESTKDKNLKGVHNNMQEYIKKRLFFLYIYSIKSRLAIF